MNSLGNSSKWACYDSPPSASSFLLSESDQTEDEADVFSEAEGYSGRAKSLSANEGITVSANYLGFAGQPEPHSKSKYDKYKHCHNETEHPNSASSPGAATLGSSCATPGDLAFAQKVTMFKLIPRFLNLKWGKISLISDIITLVKMGMLSTILCIIIKKYLQNLLQIEMMLKMWFPQVTCQSTHTPNQTTTLRLSQNWHQNQLHMPVKKRKLSWSNPEDTGKVPTKHHQHEKHGSCQASVSLHAVSTCLPGPPKRRKILEDEAVKPSGNSCTARNEFTDSNGALSRPYFHSRRENENRKQSQISLPSPCCSPATQDSSLALTDLATTWRCCSMPARVKAEGGFHYISIMLGVAPVCNGCKARLINEEAEGETLICQ
uniref:Uncharacterized protein n=1 Tax=Anabas testudineus TaxID=64144 RepID=A0A7N6AN37_ANATE